MCLRDGRELSSVQNLVGISVANTADDSRIGQSALERAVFRGQRSAERLESAGEDINAARINGLQVLLTVENIQRGAMLAASFGEHKRTVGKIKGGETLPPSQFCSTLPPVQTTGDHQVQDHPQIALNADSNPLPDAPQFTNFAALDFRDCRLHRS